MTLEEATDIFLYAGGKGGTSSSASSNVISGGFNGGGYRYGYSGGGGASDIRIGTDSLYARVIVAGGGGSDGNAAKGGGAGGGISGQTTPATNYGTGGLGGQSTYSGSSTSTTATTQATSGLNTSNTSLTYGGFGFGGAGLSVSSGYGGAGGGGWYGGQGTLPDSSGDDDKGGGGGSGFVYTQEAASSVPIGYLLSGKYYLTQAETKQGIASFTSPNNTTETGHSGDGYVRITVGEVINNPRRRKSARIQQKGNSSTEWDPNAILLSREIGIETDTNKMKIGDGITPWSLLPYCNSSASDEEIKRIKYYGDPDIIPSNESYFTVNSTGETITGLTDTGKTQTELVIPYKINGKEITTLHSGVDDPELQPQSILGDSTTITNVTIPKSITTLGRGAFYYRESLTSINIPDSITSIGNYAFSGCSSLTSVNIPNSVNSIGESAFYNCQKLTSVNISNNITSIGPNTFSSCTSLTSINIPNSITSIGTYAFSSCTSLTSINIPNSVIIIGRGAFYSCTGLTSITIPNSVTSIDSTALNGCTNLTIYCEQGSYAETYAKEKNIPVVYTDVSNIATETELERLHYYGDSTIIPSDENYFTVNSTGETITGLTDAGKGLTDIIIPYSINNKIITTIGETSGIFSSNTRIRTMIIPNTITNIGIGTFSSCTSLTSINIPDSIKTIASSLFSGCTSLSSINIPDSVTAIGDNAFKNCILSSISIPDTVTYIGSTVFDGCTNLTKIYCRQGSYADSYFTANYPDINIIYTDINKTELDKKADINNVLTKDNTTEYTPSADYQPATKKYVDDIVSAGGGVIVIDSELSDTSTHAVQNKVIKQAMDLKADEVEVERIKYYKDPDIVPSDENYFTVNATGETITGLSDTGKTQTKLVIPYKIWGIKITSIGENAFQSCKSLTSIDIPNSVTSIGNNAFAGCSSLTSINIPNSVTSIGRSAFVECSSLTTINIPNSITSIGSGVFADCTSLTTINIPNSVTSIGNNAFHGCSSLTSIDIPNSITSIGEDVFSNCTSLTSVNIPNSVTSINSWTFQGCSSLTSITIPNSVTSIIDEAFKYCSSLTSITIPKSVTSIGENAFHVYDAESSSYVPISGLTIYCEPGSYAEQYAKENNIPVVYTDVKVSTLVGQKNASGGEIFNYYEDTVVFGQKNSAGFYAHAEGASTTASGYYSHAEGIHATASGEASHAEGRETHASGYYSHAEGDGTIASKESQHVQGKYNIEDTSKTSYAHIVGNGTSDSARSNAHTLDWKGNAWYAGNVTVGGTYNSETGVVDNVKTLATQEYVDTKVAESSSIDETAIHYKGELAGTSLPATPAFGDVWKVGNDITIFGIASIPSSYVVATSENTIEFDGDPSSAVVIYPGTKFTAILNSDETKTLNCTVKYTKVQHMSDGTSPSAVYIYVNEDISTAFNITSYVQISTGNLNGNSLNVKPGDLIVYTYSGWQKFYSGQDKLELERLNYYGDKDIVPSDESYFIVNETGETITGLTDTGKTQTELVIPYKINGVEITNLYSGINSTSILDGNTVITKIVLPNTITTIGRNVFYKCSLLTSINIPNSVTSIGNTAFSECTSLTSITIPNSVTNIGNSAFRNCSSLTSINIPNSVTSISPSAFRGCTNLTTYCEQGSYAETYAKTNNISVAYNVVKDITSSKVTTITVPTTGWTTSTDTNGTTYYSINITDSILTSTGYPITDVVLPSDIAAARLQSEAYQNVNKITVNDGSVDLYCFDSLPTVSFQIRIQLLYI